MHYCCGSLGQAFRVFPVRRDHTDPDEFVHVFLPEVVLQLTTGGLPAACTRVQGPEEGREPPGRIFNGVQAKQRSQVLQESQEKRLQAYLKLL